MPAVTFSPFEVDILARKFGKTNDEMEDMLSSSSPADLAEIVQQLRWLVSQMGMALMACISSLPDKAPTSGAV